MTLAEKLVEIHRRTAKPRDIVWNRVLARPLASLLLLPMERSRITPNQVTIASLLLFIAAAGLLGGWLGHAGLLVAVGLIEISYVLDCVDGQIARLRGTSSAVGAHLDFLMDELKAFVLVAVTGTRLWRERDSSLWLLEALVALAAVAAAVSLTTFVRRPEYLAEGGAAPGAGAGAGNYGQGFSPEPASEPPAAASTLARALRAVEAIGRFVIHYPSYLVLVAIVNRLDLFLHAYALVNAAYAGRTFLGVARRLGRPVPPQP